MEPVFDRSKSGAWSASRGSLRLHSAYDPAAEAERFLDTALGEKKPPLVILSGACLDYLSPALRSRLKGSTILSLQFDPAFRVRGPRAELGLAPGPLPGDTRFAEHFPDEGDLASFLGARLDEDLASGLCCLEWPPAVRAYPEEAERTARALRAAVDKVVSSAATLKVFGASWFANACRSFLLTESLAEPGRLGGPIVLAAAGPSLEEALEDLEPYRGRFRLVVVSSAFAAVRARGFEADLVVATDGGFWSRAHLYPMAAAASGYEEAAVREGDGKAAAPIASPLSALPSACLSGGASLLLLEQDGFPERELAAALGGGLQVPSHGTVSGTALSLACLLSDGSPILCAGFDFAALDVRGHAGPHGFDRFLDGAASRLAPGEVRAYARGRAEAPNPLAGGPWRSSRSLATYAASLGAEALSARRGGGLYRLRPSPMAVGGLETADAGLLGAILDGPALPPPAWRVRGAPPLSAREAALSRLFAASRLAARRAAEALSGGALPEDPRARELCRTLDLPDWAAARRAVILGGDPRPAASALEASLLGQLESLEGRLLR
ncbi:MAG: hypothetical protein JNG85_03920 [Spirochaetaceae bacterium]|nr:hypothetical protein [Spirochaetaceae bacterium]